MPRTRLAATALSLVAVLAACGTDDRPEADRPEATESSRSQRPVGHRHRHQRPDARPLTYTDDYAGDPSPDIHWLMKSIQYGDRTLRPGIDVTVMDLTDDGNNTAPLPLEGSTKPQCRDGRFTHSSGVGRAHQPALMRALPARRSVVADSPVGRSTCGLVQR